LPTNKISLAAAALLLACLLSSCITTTSGGFAVEASEERALENFIQLALAYFDENDMASARLHINNVLNIDSRNAEAYAIMALILQREGDLELSEQNFRRSIRLDRNNSRTRNNFAALLFTLGRYADAVDELEQVTLDTNYTGRAIAFENLGRSALRLDRLETAEHAFVRSLQLDSNRYIAALELAKLKFVGQDWDAARQNYQRYLTIVAFYKLPHSPNALLAGIEIEGHFDNQQIVDDFGLVLRTLYQKSPEYQLYRKLSDAN